jgi:hypothetical protein
VEQFLSRHAGNVIATLSGFDRLVFRGTLRMLAHRGGMMSYLWAVRVLLKDFAAHAEARSGVHETGASPRRLGLCGPWLKRPARSGSA